MIVPRFARLLAVHYRLRDTSRPKKKHVSTDINWVPKDSWFRRENPSKMDDLGVLLFQEKPPYQELKYIQRWKRRDEGSLVAILEVDNSNIVR